METYEYSLLIETCLVRFTSKGITHVGGSPISRQTHTRWEVHQTQVTSGIGAKLGCRTVHESNENQYILREAINKQQDTRSGTPPATEIVDFSSTPTTMAISR